jgi:uncharacterized protein YjcR
MSRIHFHDLKIGQISSSSGVFSGDNRQFGWRASKKTNDGNGTVTGNHNTFTEGRYSVFQPQETSESTDEKEG